MPGIVRLIRNTKKRGREFNEQSYFILNIIRLIRNTNFDTITILRQILHFQQLDQKKSEMLFLQLAIGVNPIYGRARQKTILNF